MRNGAVQTRTPMSLRVGFPGDQSRMLILDSCTTANELIAKAASKMQLQNFDEFALSVSSVSGSTVPVMPDDYMLDVLNASERYALDLSTAHPEQER